MSRRYRACVKCQAETTHPLGGKRLDLDLCEECFDVFERNADGRPLLTCMECDERSVRSEADFSCKPCRVKREAPRPRRYWPDRNPNKDDHESNPSQENGVRALESGGAS